MRFCPPHPPLPEGPPLEPTAPKYCSRVGVIMRVRSLSPAWGALLNVLPPLLQAEWKESETGREAKFYFLTKKGRRQMEEEARNWDRLCDAVGLVLSAQEKAS